MSIVRATRVCSLLAAVTAVAACVEPEPIELGGPPPSPEPGGWRAQSSGTTGMLFDVWFHDTQRGWVVGDDGIVLRTIDGGATWTAQNVAPATALLRDIEFADALHGWIGGYQVVYATVDGGETWVAHPDPTPWLTELSFVSATTGWMASESLYRTDDGGATWQLQAAGSEYLQYHHVTMVDALHGWAVARADGGQGDVNGASIIFHTSDGGATWQRQLSAGGWETGLADVVPAGPVQAWSFGVGSNHDSLDEYQHVSRDGVTWQRTPDSANGTALSDAQFLDADRGWACGYAGSLIHTDDGGATWQVQKVARWEYAEGHTLPLEPSLHGLHFVDADHGWAVGHDGTILVTDTGGEAGS